MFSEDGLQELADRHYRLHESSAPTEKDKFLTKHHLHEYEHLLQQAELVSYNAIEPSSVNNYKL